MNSILLVMEKENCTKNSHGLSIYISKIHYQLSSVISGSNIVSKRAKQDRTTFKVTLSSAVLGAY
jgi:hypothetical protein